MAKKTVAAKKRNVKVDAAGQLHVHSSFNNIIVCLANSEGQVISWSSAGKMGFRGSKKNTPYAAQMAAHPNVVACKRPPERGISHNPTQQSFHFTIYPPYPCIHGRLRPAHRRKVREQPLLHRCLIRDVASLPEPQRPARI